MAIRPNPGWTWAAAITAGLLASSGLVPPGTGAAPVPPVGAGPGAMGLPMGMRPADQRFIVMMIPHHDGAIAMADLALTRARRPEIQALAQRIKASQTEENAQMRRWYRQWYGANVPAWTLGGPGSGMGMAGPMGMGMGGAMPGLATSLEALKAAPDFDRAFIEQMIPHHRVGVMMASHAQWHSQHPELRSLQAAMVRVQSQEIAQMELWYRQWYGS